MAVEASILWDPTKPRPEPHRGFQITDPIPKADFTTHFDDGPPKRFHHRWENGCCRDGAFGHKGSRFAVVPGQDFEDPLDIGPGGPAGQFSIGKGPAPPSPNR